MPMIARVFPLLQAPSSTMLIFFVFRLILAMLLVLVLILLEKMCGEWSLVPHLFFSDVLSFSSSRPVT
jgi:hypothetical protein